jgi:hypothetical protein
MSAEWERARGKLRRLAQGSREFGRIPEGRFPVRPQGSEDIDWRQNGRFYDQSGQPMWGFEQWGFEW